MSAETPNRGGTLRLAVLTDPHSLDAAQLFSNEEGMLGLLLFNTLLDANPDGGFKPGLADGLPTTSPDGLTHTFVLRRGVRFSNGRELVADDVVFSFERMFDPKVEAGTPAYFQAIQGGASFQAARKQEMASGSNSPPHVVPRWIEPITVAGLRALGRYTVQIQLNQPDLSFLQILTTPPAGIVPRDEAERAGRQFASHPVGSGPFLLKEWVRGGHIRFARNPYYFRAGAPGPDAVDVLVNVDLTTQTMMFERGELDFQHYIPDPDFVRLKKSPQVQGLLQKVAGTSPTFVFMNCELPPFTNRLVRLALNHAVDKQALVKVMNHRCVPSIGPLPLVVSGFNSNLPEYSYDPPRARALLAEGGLTNGFETALWVNRDSQQHMKVALFVQQCLTEVGVHAQIKEASFAAMLAASGNRGNVPMGVSDWLTISDDPKETLDTLLNGDNIADEGCLNIAFYANPRVQAWFRDALAETNPVRRLNIYRQIERQVVEDVPWIFLVQLNTEMRVQHWVKGFTPRGFWPPARLENCWLER